MKQVSSTRIALRVDRLVKYYEGKPLLNELSFTIGAKEIVCLLGPSGSGKSTLLRIIAGLEPFDGGSLFWHGHGLVKIPTELRSFGLMFQDYALFPHLNVFENVAFGLHMQHLSKVSIKQKVDHALEKVGMLGYATRKVQKLSGGEQQRIALARSLAPEPKLIMLDEPLGALDRKLREQLIQEIRQILRTSGVPAIYVTHDQDEAFALADRILILANGRISQIGSPEELYNFPVDTLVANFLGLGNIIKGVVLSINPFIIRTNLGDLHYKPQCKSYPIGTIVSILIRPDGVEIASKSKNNFQAIVGDCVFQGDHYRTVVKVNGHSLIIDLPNKYLPGNQIHLTFIIEKLLVLIEDSQESI